MENKNLWYALTGENYKQWDIGTHDYERALTMLLDDHYYKDFDTIVVIDEEDNFAIKEISVYDI